MPVSNNDRDRIMSALDSLDEVLLNIVLASLEAFAKWLAIQLPTIFERIRDSIRAIWQSIKTAFA